MHPAWAGAGGQWPVIDQIFDPVIVKQQDKLSCGFACGQMLLADRGISVSQQVLADEIGTPVFAEELADTLNIFDPLLLNPWIGGPLHIPQTHPEQIILALNTTGSWAAMFWETGVKIGHMVVVDGVDENGLILIRDPWDGTRYKMLKNDFLKYWNFYGVYRRQL